MTDDATDTTDGRTRAAHAARDDAGSPEAARLRELHDLVDHLAPRLPVEVLTSARETLDVLGSRIDRGIEHTVVALVGGTGSGKSSLFNAISGLDVADVGARRPTTAVPTGAVWGSRASTLLDHLEVPTDRRYRGEQALAGPVPGSLDGVVLLDVPDHDSIAQGHRRHVDRLVPLVDLLVWVLDPQKYADQRLHGDYLAALAGRQEAMVVVLNQVDTLTESGRDQLRLDIARLLVGEGLGEVEILLVSARTGEGVPTLRETLRRTGERSSAGRVAVRAQLVSLTQDLAAAIGTGAVPDVEDAAAVGRLADVLGTEAVADALAAAHRGEGGAVTGVRTPSRARVDAVRSAWVEELTAGLPAAWRSAVDAAVPGAGAISGDAVAALAEIAAAPPPTPGLLARLRRGRLERAGDEAAAAYRTAATAALAPVVARTLAPARAELAALASARATLGADTR
ncbi:GTPase [Litorihabitans aurantiacus]|uniref:G domain-containing protein n=1 Tax=Litorihabitans aurantiacus TaxID=1930061 RepID=A0AA37XES4_9MICO|nr:GTPase [Litorihabitans aurantiacus]GMA31921.1 hypothetical protein GCM10025875_19130 [Litorihabitans aurantiacus]